MKPSTPVENAAYEGHTVAEIAAVLGISPGEAIVQDHELTGKQPGIVMP